MEDDEAQTDKPLAGRRILVPESREIDLFARMLEARGAEAVRCPMVAIYDLDDPAPVEAWLRRLASGAFNDLILLTGEGLRRLLGVAKRAGIEPETIAALGRLRIITRGPKPARVLRELGLAPGLAAEAPTTAGVIATLRRESLGGRRIGVQLYPGNPNRLLIDFFRQAGAEPDPVVPYRYASDAEAHAVEASIRAMAAGAYDAIAFTSTSQLERLQAVAKERNIETELRQGLQRLRVAAVGPVIAAALARLGVGAATPAASFHMKPLIGTLVEMLADSSTRR